MNKKIFIFFLCFIASLFKCQFSSAEETIPQNHTTLFVNFEDNDSSGNIKDCGSGNVVKITSATPQFTTGKFGYGFRTGEKYGAILVPTSPHLDLTSNFTMLFWIKPRAFGQRKKILSKRSKDRLESFVTIAEDMGQLYAAAGEGKDFVITPKTTSLQLNQWQLIGLTLNATTKTLSLFLNGEKLHEIECPYSLANSSAALSIGSDFEGTSDFFEGEFDEIHVLNVSLKPSEIWETFVSQGNRPSENDRESFMKDNQLRLYFPFDEKNTHTATNFFKGSINGTLAGNGIYWDEGMIGGALSMTLPDDSVSIKDYTPDTFLGDFSISFWAKPDEIKGIQRLFTLENPHSIKTFFSIGFEDDTLFCTCDPSLKKSETLRGAEKIIREKWNHITVTFSKKDKLFKIFLNGIKCSEGTLNTEILSMGFPITLGGRNEKKSDHFKGQIDELKIYGKSLSEEEVLKESKMGFSFFENTFWKFPYNCIEKGMICNFPFDWDQSHFINDISRADNSGYFNSLGKDFFALGKTGYGLHFNGLSGAINIPSNHYLENLTSFTLCSWIRQIAPERKQILFSRLSQTNGNQSISTGFDSGFPFFEINDGQKATLTKSTIPLKGNVWQHVTFTYDFWEKTLRIFLDGEKILEEKIQTNFSGVLKMNSIGGAFNGKDNCLNAILDDFRLFNTVFPPEEIKILMNSLELKHPLGISAPSQETKPKPKSESLPTPSSPTSIQEVPLPPPDRQTAEKTEEKDVSETQAEKETAASVTEPVKNTESTESKSFKNNGKFPFSYTTLPPYNFKLNLVSFFKKNALIAYFSFESQEEAKNFNDEIKNYTLNSTGKEDPSLISGRIGKGLLIHPETTLTLSPLSLRFPQNLSLEFSLFPVKFNADPQAVLTITNETKKILLSLSIEKGRLFASHGDGKKSDTGILLMEKNWQNILISCNQETHSVTFYKNNHPFNSLEIPFSFSSPVTVLLGKGKELSGEMILDELKIYQHAFTGEIDMPSAPSNPCIAVLEEEDPGKIPENVTVLLSCENAQEMLLSEDRDFNDTRWKPFKLRISLQTLPKPGIHHIYCKFRNASNFETGIVETQYTIKDRGKEIEFLNPLKGSSIPGKR